MHFDISMQWIKILNNIEIFKATETFNYIIWHKSS